MSSKTGSKIQADTTKQPSQSCKDTVSTDYILQTTKPKYPGSNPGRAITYFVI